MSTPYRGTTANWRFGTVPGMGNNLKKLRNFRGWTLDEAAQRFGLSRGGYIKIERSERGLGDKHIQRASKVYSVPPHEVFDEPRFARIVGIVGAGGEVAYDVAIEGDDQIAVPADAPEETVAVEIRGDSLGPGFDRWFALYARREDPFLETWLGSLCVVGTADGRTLVKWVRRGQNGCYNLLSGVGGIEENVELAWAARVLDLKPRLG